MQNDIPTSINSSESKPGVEFHYEGRLFSKSEVAYIYASTVDLDISSKFDLQIDFLDDVTKPKKGDYITAILKIDVTPQAIRIKFGMLSQKIVINRKLTQTAGTVSVLMQKYK